MPLEPHEVPAAAKRALFAAGVELPGRRLTQFAERLVTLAEHAPEAAGAELAAHAVEEIRGGAVALIGEEPDLRDVHLDAPALTVAQAAESALGSLGERVVSLHRRGRSRGSREWLLGHLDEQAKGLTELTRSAADRDDMKALIAVRDQIFVMRETLATLGVPLSTVANDAWNRGIGTRF